MNAYTSHLRTCLSIFSAVLLSVGLMSTAMAAGGADLERYLPDNTKGVVSMDVDKLRKSGTLETLMKSTGANKRLNSVNSQLSSVGFKPLEQIDKALLQVSGFDKNTEPLLIFEGRFPRAAIEEALTKEAHATRKKIGDIVVYTQGKRGSLAFLSPKIATIGPTAAVEAAAAIAANKTTSKPSSAVRKAIRDANDARDVWFVADLPNEYLNKTPFKGAKMVYGEADITADLLLTIHARMPSSDAASSTVKNVQKTLADMAERDEIAAIGLAPVVQAISVSNASSTVNTRLTLDKNRFRRLLVTIATVVRDQMQ